MCLIISKPKNIPINSEWLEMGFKTNSDSWGVMWSGGKKVHVEKGFKVEGLKECMGKLDDSLPVAIHMRTATSGKKDLINAHPIKVGNGMWLMHNGMIGIPIPNKEWSDTKHFAELAVKPILSTYPALFGQKQLVGMLEYFIGSANKLLIMKGNGDTMLVNENGGTWKEKCWLSNTYSITEKPAAKYVPPHLGFENDEWEDYTTRSSRWEKAFQPEKKDELEGHFCEMCKVYAQAKVGSWTQASGVGWICESCWKFIADSIEAVQDIGLYELSLMSYNEIIEVCKNFPETIAWAILAKVTDIKKMEEGNGQRIESNSVGA
jgi:hypothetical protein